MCVVAGNYESLPADRLPPVWLAYLSDPTDSGKIHNNVKQRWLQSKSWTFFTCQPSSTEYRLAIDCTEDEEVLKAMDHFAELTDQARQAALVCVCQLVCVFTITCPTTMLSLTMLLNMSLSLFRDAIMKKDHERYSDDYAYLIKYMYYNHSLTVGMPHNVYMYIVRQPFLPLTLCDSIRTVAWSSSFIVQCIVSSVNMYICNCRLSALLDENFDTRRYCMRPTAHCINLAI